MQKFNFYKIDIYIYLPGTLAACFWDEPVLRVSIRAETTTQSTLSYKQTAYVTAIFWAVYCQAISLAICKCEAC